MQAHHQDIKEFSKRVSTESKKVKDLAAQMEKIKKTLENEKKVYMVDFLKNFELYVENAQLSPQLLDILKNHAKNLSKIEADYDRATKHITDVSCNALGYLPKKFETYQKSIVVANKIPENYNKLKDFEFDRIEYTQKALLHFFNTQMLIHAQALQVHSQTFEELAKHNEGQDICSMHENGQWAIEKMRGLGYQVSRSSRLFSSGQLHDEYEYSVHDLIPKDQNIVFKDPSTLKSSITYQLGLQSEDSSKNPLWLQLSHEIINHVRSREFREDFFPLIRNDEINIKLFILHLYLITERLKAIPNPYPLLKLSKKLSHSYGIFLLNTQKFPKSFYYTLYEKFHSHLPEELFFDDFLIFFKNASKQTYSHLSNTFDKIDKLPQSSDKEENEHN